MRSALSGREVVAWLKTSGDEINDALLPLQLSADSRKALLDFLHARLRVWPAVIPKSLHRRWVELTLEIRQLAAALVRPEGGGGAAPAAADFEGYLKRVVLAQIHLEATEPPAALADARADALFTPARASSLRRHGFVVIEDALAPFGIEPGLLHADIALLHRHGVIPPAGSSCNVGAHGVMLRCGTEVERAQFVQQRTTALLRACELLRSLPRALQKWGIATPTLQVPGSVLVSTYPPGGPAYLRHLDTYGDDNCRAFTFILYANERWPEADGGALRAEVDGAEVDVAPRAGTLVVFDSRRIWHQVLPSAAWAANRHAVTLWAWDSRDEAPPPGSLADEDAGPQSPPPHALLVRRCVGEREAGGQLATGAPDGGGAAERSTMPSDGAAHSARTDCITEWRWTDAR